MRYERIWGQRPIDELPMGQMSKKRARKGVRNLKLTPMIRLAKRSAQRPLLRYLYTGREFDAKTGLMYYLARFYGPTLGMILPWGDGRALRLFWLHNIDIIDFIILKKASP